MDPTLAELDDRYFSLAAQVAESVCLARNAQGYACSLEPGHEGWHRAELDHGEFETWPPLERSA